MSVFRVSYDDGGIVRFYDSKLREFKTSTLSVQSCQAEKVELAKGINHVKLHDNTVLVTDARNLGGADEGRFHRWYAKTSALTKEGLKMNSVWKPAFCVIKEGGFLFSNLDGETNLVVVPNMNVSIALKRSNEAIIKEGILVMPLLETIVNIQPAFSQRSLKAICADMHEEYVEWMEDQVAVMANLFERFKDAFNIVSTKEACSFGELCDCLFENTFRCSLHQKPICSLGKEAVTSLFLANRSLFVKSAFVSNDCFGDIAWHLPGNTKGNQLLGLTPATVFNEPFALLSKKHPIKLSCSFIDYIYVFIFPPMDVDGRSYPYGSMVAMKENNQVDFYGQLFEEVTPREQLYVSYLFEDLCNNILHPVKSAPHEVYRKQQLPARYRPQLIEKIKECFLANRTPK